MHFLVLVFQRNTLNIFVNLLAIFLLGDENTNAKIFHLQTRCKITAGILASVILCDLKYQVQSKVLRNKLLPAHFITCGVDYIHFNVIVLCI